MQSTTTTSQRKICGIVLGKKFNNKQHALCTMLCDAPGTYLKYFFQPYMNIVATETMETLDNVQKVIIIPWKKKKESFKDNSDH